MGIWKNLTQLRHSASALPALRALSDPGLAWATRELAERLVRDAPLAHEGQRRFETGGTVLGVTLEGNSARGEARLLVMDETTGCATGWRIRDSRVVSEPAFEPADPGATHADRLEQMAAMGVLLQEFGAHYLRYHTSLIVPHVPGEILTREAMSITVPDRDPADRTDLQIGESLRHLYARMNGAEGRDAEVRAALVEEVNGLRESLGDLRHRHSFAGMVEAWDRRAPSPEF